jgi:hypothetical protein
VLRASEPLAAAADFRNVNGDVYELLQSEAAKKDDVLLVRKAVKLGATDRMCRELRVIRKEYGLPRGAVLIPPVRDVLRARARAAQLVVPAGVLTGATAARLLGLQGLPWAEVTDPLDLVLPTDRTRWQRKDLRLHWSDLEPAEIVLVDGLRVTNAERSLTDLHAQLDYTTFVCLADSAVHQELISAERLVALRSESSPDRAERWQLVNGQSESPSETRVRLVLIRGGLAPDELQLQVCDDSGRVIARLDLAWSRRRVGLEVDSAEHDRPTALYRDRYRQNDLRHLRWDIRHVTASDARNRPAYVLSVVRSALAAA